MSNADPRELTGSLIYWLHTWPRRYGFAVIAVVATTVLQYGLKSYLGFAHPFTPFYPTILLIGLLAGLWPGIVATVLAALLAMYFFLAPVSSFVVAKASDIVGLAIFGVTGLAICGVAEFTRRRVGRLQEFERVVEGLEEMIVVVDRDYRYIIANRAFLKYRGMTREQVIGHRVPEILNPGVFEAEVKEKLDECFRGRIVQYEMQYRYPSLGERGLLISYFPIEGPSGVERAACILQDVTQKKWAEEALRESEDRYRDLVEHSEDLLCTHDLEGRLLSVNPAPARVLGYEVNELLAVPLPELIAPEFREQFGAYLERIKKNGADKGVMCVVTRSGERRIWEYSNTLRTEGVTTPVVRGMAHDVTERKRAEHSLRRREEDYRRFVAQSSEGIFRQDLDAPLPINLPEDELVHRILYDSYMAECNDAMARMYGLTSSQDLVGERLTEMVVPDDPRNLELTREYIRSGFRVLERESHEVDAHGNPKIFLNSMIGIVENGKLMRTWGIQRDVTERVKIEEARKKAEEALQGSEAHFRILVEQASDGIFVADAAGGYVDVNSAGAEMLGYTRNEILQLGLPDVLATEEVPRIETEVARFAGGETIRSEWKFRRKDGSIFPGEVSGRRLPDGRLQGILRDMTERKRAEEVLQRSEERFRVALKDSPITVFNQDRELRYTWIYNPHLFVQHEVIGRTDDEIMGADQARRLNEIKRRVLATGVGAREEVLIPHNGSRHSLDFTIEPLFDSESNIIGITGAAMDIARLRELVDGLQEAKDKLVLEKSYLEGEIQAELGFEEIIGQSSALREVLKQARIVAPTDSTVLLLGETGTGKELVARSVHALSTRREESFIKLNCAAVPSGLLESELFGHEKGAFTGAVNQKVGRLELADKGTLFLDEVGELPLELQPKLLRVLQDREFERLGGVRTVRVDVRIISATNRDLKKDVADKRFREDLFYRLNVFPIEMPPLRERRSDIPILVHKFVHKRAARMGKRIDNIPPETMAVLQKWNWPGNVRELENVIERMVILSKGSELAAPPAELHALHEMPDDSLTDMAREHIIRVLRETNGNLSGLDGAASRLGIKRTTLQSMLKRLDINLRDYRRGTGTFGRE